MSKATRNPRREPLVLFLDDGFCGNRVSSPLREAGYTVVDFETQFPDDERVRQQEVDDKPIIQLCSKKRWLIVTRDSHMRVDHIDTIRRCRHTMILATANNNKGDLASWVDGLLKAMPAVIERHQLQMRPWYAQYDRSGKIMVCKTIECPAPKKRTRRNRA